MPKIARLGDVVQHPNAQGVISSASTDHFVDGIAVARLGDKVACPLHGTQVITQVDSTVPLSGNKPVAHIGARTGCGAIVATGSPTMTIGSTGTTSVIDNGQTYTFETAEVQAMQNEKDDFVGTSTVYPPPEIGENSTEPGDTDTTPAPPVGPIPRDCSGLTGNEPLSFRLSKYHTLADLTVRGIGDRAGDIPLQGQLGLSRLQIICNLRNLSNTTLVPIIDYFGRERVRAASSFRLAVGKQGPYHPRGCASDLHFYSSGTNRMNKRDLLAAAQWIRDNVPFTQILLEFPNSQFGWIHIALNERGLIGQTARLGTINQNSKFSPGFSLPA